MSNLFRTANPCAWLDAKEWRDVKESVPMGLSKPRFVSRVGYEVDFGTVLAALLKEAPPYDQARNPVMESMWTPEDGIPRLEHSVVNRLILRHPLFEKYREARRDLVSKMVETVPITRHAYEFGGWTEPNTTENALLAKADREIVSAVIRQKVEDAVGRSSGKKRFVWFETADELLQRFIRSRDAVIVDEARQRLDLDWWHGPWTIEARRVCKTGTYWPASGGQDEYDPAYLAEEKTHVLFRVCKNQPDKWYSGLTAAVLKEDVFEWKMKETLETIEKSAEVA